jgi:cell wall-associated NlpC family hydrolase
MYKQRPVELLDVIVATKSFSSMVDQLNMLHRVSSSESTMVDSIGSFQQTIKTAQKSLVTDQTAAQQVVAQRATEKAGVESALAARQSLLRGVQSQISQLEAQQAQAARQSAQKSGAYVPSAAPVNPDHSSVVAFAASFVGKVPYVWGGASPSGFDCSGFTMYCWANFGVGLPHNAAAQQAMSAPVSAAQAQPGDLVFFGSPIHHVGMYVGGGNFIEAPYTGVNVRITPLSHRHDFAGACRPAAGK